MGFLDETLASEPHGDLLELRELNMRKNPLFVAFVIWAFVLTAVGQNQSVQSSAQSSHRLQQVQFRHRAQFCRTARL
jgi:hypothetical protein